MKGRAIRYTADQLAWIKANRTLPRHQLHAQFCKKFRRQDVSKSNLTGLCKRRGWLTGRTGRFSPGQESHNKGKKMPFNPNSARTRFKKGREPHNTKYLGHERISVNGYVEISVAETNPHTGYHRRYVLKHRYLWEQENGPLPDDMCLKCLDGDKTNTAPSNWHPISRALLPRLSGGRWFQPYDAYHPDIRPTVLALAKLENAARAARDQSTPPQPKGQKVATE